MSGVDDDDGRFITPEDQVGILQAFVENLRRDNASLILEAQSAPILKARIAALEAEVARLQDALAAAEARGRDEAIARLDAFLNRKDDAALDARLDAALADINGGYTATMALYRQAMLAVLPPEPPA